MARSIGAVDRRERLANPTVRFALAQRVPQQFVAGGAGWLHRQVVPAVACGTDVANHEAQRAERLVRNQQRGGARQPADERRDAARAKHQSASIEPHERQRAREQRVGERDAGSGSARQSGHHCAKDLRLIHTDSPLLRFRPAGLRAFRLRRRWLAGQPVPA